MSKFYTYSKAVGNNVIARYYEGGEQFTEKVPFKPTLFLPSKLKETEWKDFYNGSPLDVHEFDSIKAAKEFIETYKEVQGISVHGFQKFEYQYINKEFPGEIDYDPTMIRTLILDIETVSEDEDSFPDIQLADVPIVLISLYNSVDGKLSVLGLKPYDDSNDDFEYKLFSSEQELLKYFIAFNQIHNFDVWSGWNTEGFDIPYIVNRISNLFDLAMVKKLSPFNYVREKKIEIRGKFVQTYEIYGIVSLDYLEFYKKFMVSSKVSYALGAIAQEELGETKHELPGISFRDNYQNHFKEFVFYSAKDSLLVKKIDDKLKIIDLAFTIAYLYKCNIQDVLRTVAPWEIFIFNSLADKKIAYPPRRNNPVAPLEGAWVKEPIPGMYGWSMSFDFSALYATIIRQWNISPETFIPAKTSLVVSDFMQYSDAAKAALEYAKEQNCSLACNGTMYDNSVMGIIPELVSMSTIKRNIAKKSMLELEKIYQTNHDDSLMPKIISLNNKQLSFKLVGNGVYGAMNNSAFHFYDYRMGEAITLSGQLSDMHLADKFNINFNKILKSVDKDYVVYGDSVSGDSIIDVNGEKLKIQTFFDSHLHTDCDDKEYVLPCIESTTLTLDESRLSRNKILHVMRHKIKKEMFRITVLDKSVDVTEDHSIIVRRNEVLIEVKPRQILSTDFIITIK